MSNFVKEKFTSLLGGSKSETWRTTCISSRNAQTLDLCFFLIRKAGKKKVLLTLTRPIKGQRDKCQKGNYQFINPFLVNPQVNIVRNGLVFQISLRLCCLFTARTCRTEEKEWVMEQDSAAWNLSGFPSGLLCISSHHSRRAHTMCLIVVLFLVKCLF